MTQKLLLVALSLATFTLSSQDFNMDLLQDLRPRNIGPGGMSGRVTAIDVVNKNTDVMYVGTASGGVWKSTSGGIKWEPIFDKELTASVGALAIQQSNPSVIWVGTGEGNPRNSLNGGYGIYKSLDGGKNWKAMGLEKTRHIHRVVIDPTNPDVVYAAAIGSPWGEHPERGIFKTTDGGESWEKILFVNNKTGAADLVMDPSNPNKLIAAMWEHKRDPWFFNSGGKGSGLHITHDGGKTWKKVTPEDGFPKGNLGRMGIAIAKNKPNVVYALVEAKKNALYRSDDGGFKWKKVNDKADIGNRPFYYCEIYVDPENENRVYSVFTFVNVSEDGGKNFKQLMNAYGGDVTNGVHPDHHALWIDPQNGQFLIDGNDGGMNISRDGGKTWRFIGNLPVAQFYHINADNEYPYNVYGGMQDNGSWRGPAYVWKAQGIRNSYWQEISFGDGFDVVPDKDDSRYGYTMSQQGYVQRYDWQTGNNYMVRPTPPDAKTKLRFNWNAAIGQDPFDNNTAYFGSQFVHKTNDKGLTWEIISPDLTTNDPEKQKQTESGGLNIDATGAENYTTILVVEPSSVEKDMLWVGTDDGRVHYTRNGGTDWIDVTQNIKGMAPGSWIPQIKASNKNKGEALLIANDYRRFNYTPYAFRTRNYGKTWERIVDGNDVQSFTLSIVEDIENKNLLFLGTDDGLYVSFDAGNKWQKWSDEGYPTVPTMDLVVQPREHDLVIGTFGRAAWVLDDIRPLRALASDKTFLQKDVALFPSPTAYQAAYQQPTGSRFGGDALYNAENRKDGAMITYYLKEGKDPLKKPEKKEENEKAEEDSDSEEITSQARNGVAKKDSIQFQFFDGDRLIRTLKYKTPEKAGFHRIYWNMDEKGADSASRKISKSKNEPSGLSVKPGNYRVVVMHGDTSDETTIEVLSDPRLEVSSTAISEAYEVGQKLMRQQQIAADAVKQLVESKKVAKKYEKELKEQDKEKYKTEIEASKAIVKQIDSIITIYIGKEDKRQGLTRSTDPNVVSRIQNASYYAQTRQSGLTETEKRLIRLAEADLKKALDKTNTFFNEKWKAYRETIEKAQASLFKEIKSFSMD